jgi:hypothetical protein
VRTGAAVRDGRRVRGVRRLSEVRVGMVRV